MAQTRDHLIDQLIAVVQRLPVEKIAEVLDFAAHLRDAHGGLAVEQGTAIAIQAVIQQHGPLEFETGELDSILADLDHLRALDAQEPRRLPS